MANTKGPLPLAEYERMKKGYAENILRLLEELWEASGYDQETPEAFMRGLAAELERTLTEKAQIEEGQLLAHVAGQLAILPMLWKQGEPED